MNIYLIKNYIFFIKENILGGSFFWKTYKNEKVSFIFKYPSNWYIKEELYPNLGEGFIHISDQPITSNYSRGYMSRYISIGFSLEKETKEKNIKNYLKKMEAEYKEYVKNKGVPIVPGFYWYFQSYRNDLLINKNSSTAKVSGLYKEQLLFVSIINGHVYSFDLSNIDDIKSIPLRIILWTFRPIN